MEAPLVNLLVRIRSRPLAERRILAATTYATLAVVAIAIWVTSLERQFAILAQAENETPPARSSVAKPLKDLATPLESVAQSFRDAAGALRDFSKNLQSVQDPLAVSTEPQPVPPPSAEAPSVNSIHLLPPTQVPTETNRIPLRAASKPSAGIASVVAPTPTTPGFTQTAALSGFPSFGDQQPARWGIPPIFARIATLGTEIQSTLETAVQPVIAVFGQVAEAFRSFILELFRIFHFS